MKPLLGFATHVGLLFGTLASVVSGCRDHGAPLTGATPVVNLTLVAGEAVQTAFISWGARADSQVPWEPVGLDPALVSLQITDGDGTAHGLSPAPGAPGRHEVALEVRPGTTYRLSGSVAGRAIAATTTAPSAFRVVAPTPDTITSADGQLVRAVLRVPYEFEADAGAYEARVLTPGGVLKSRQVLQTGNDTLLFFLILLEGAAVHDVVFLAYNQDAAEWLTRQTPRGNIDGTFGAFGAALQVRKKLLPP